MGTRESRNSGIRVFIAVLTLGEVWRELVWRLPLIVGHGMKEGVVASVKFFGYRPSEHNRNFIVKEFLKTEYDYLLTIDEDVAPPVNVLDLAKLGKDVIGAVCPQWKENDLMWVVLDKTGGEYRQVKPDDREGLREVAAVGSGCLIMSRRVLKKVKAPFMRKWNKDGLTELGLDLHFCEKAKAVGFKVWAHWDYICGHYKKIDLLKIYYLLAKNK